MKAKKINMTQMFLASGEAVPVTLVMAINEEDLSKLADGDNITVSGISKGKGFQGVVKRHGFKGGRRSHGRSTASARRAPSAAADALEAAWPRACAWQGAWAATGSPSRISRL